MGKVGVIPKSRGRADQRIPFLRGSSNSFLRLQRNLRLLLLLYWMKPFIKVRHGSRELAWKAALNNQVRVTWEEKA